MTRISEKIKVLYISYDGAGDNLGQSQIIPYLIGLTKEGMSFVFITFEKKETLDNKELLSLLGHKLKINNIDWSYLKFRKTRLSFLKLYDLILGVLVCIRKIKKEKVKIIHGRSFIGSVIALFLKKIFKVKVILDIRGFWPEERVEAGLWNKYGLLYKITKYIERALILNADEIVILTKNAKKEIKGFGYLRNREININVIPTCVDIDGFCFQRKIDDDILNDLRLRNKFIISYVGSVSTWYMPFEMFRFFEIAQRMIDACHLMIMTKEDKFLRNVLQNIGSNVSIINVMHSIVPQYLSISKVGIAFYKPGYSRKACCPTKFGEYLACGIPIIINAGIGDCDEIILKEKVGVVIKDFSSQEYERATKELMNLFSEEYQLRQRCMAVAKQYLSLEMGVGRYRQIYERLKGI